MINQKLGMSKREETRYDRSWSAFKALGILIAALFVVLLFTGCAVMPDKVSAEIEHVSHPLAGPPFGPSNEEDGLSQATLTARWQKGRVYAESGLGYNLQGRNGGGFYGDPLTYTGRIGYEIWSKQ